MSADEVEFAHRFLEALRVAATTGDREGVYPFLAPDVEWVTPKRTLTGVGQIRDQLTWAAPPDKLDLEFGEPQTVDLGDGRIVSDVHEIYRMKGSGEFAYARDRQIELTIRAGMIVRYELRDIG